MSISKQPVIFCDFDGTITINDNIVAIMQHFKPAGYETVLEKIFFQQISIREGVGAMFALFPSCSRKEVTNYVLEQAGIREGFGEFLAFLQERSIPFYVTSGA